jgi:hypothetical protein
MPPRRFAFGIALLLAVLPLQRGEAGLIPWTYQWSAKPIVIDADPLGPHHKPGGGITLTPGAITITGGHQGVAHGSISIIAVNLTAFNFSPSPDGKYHFTKSPYQLGVKLTDVVSQKSGTLQFAGYFNGYFTQNKMVLTTSFTSAAQQSLSLGKDWYTVSLTAYSPPGPPSQGGAGNISAFVNVKPVPEPSTLLLAGTGLAAAALTWLRRGTYPKLLFRG